MKQIIPEYEITVEPSGRWRVDLFTDELCVTKASGFETGTSEVVRMEKAEHAARHWCEAALKQLREQHEYNARCKTFRMPATLKYLHGKEVTQ